MKEIFDRPIPQSIKRADLHIHTGESDGHMSINEAVEWNYHLGLDAIAITDHDKISPAEKAWDLKEQKGLKFDVIIGSEITSRDGHIIGLFLTQDIPKGLSAHETVYKIHEQGGLAIAAHPGYRTLSTSLSLEKLDENNTPLVLSANFDGFEVYNGGVAFQADMKRRKNKTPNNGNETAQKFYKENSPFLGSPIASSDNHYYVYGRVSTGFGDNLRDSISNRSTLALVSERGELKELFEKANRYFGSEKVPLERILQFEKENL